MPIFYIVATPIGNLEDISKRALRILSEVDLILCEDTRQTQKLLNNYGIRRETVSYHQHSGLKKTDFITDKLKSGKNIALVSDAGTPGISDPGNKLIEVILDANIPEMQIIPIPGPCALVSAASASGFPMDKFIFLGFPPAKKKRKKFFEEVFRQLIELKYPVIFYESCHRIIKTLKELELEAKINKVEPDFAVFRELTKKFETIYRGKPAEIADRLQKGETLGEFVVIISNQKSAKAL